MSMESPPYVPYQAYKSKRHGRAVSSNSNIESSISPPPQSQSPQTSPSPPLTTSKSPSLSFSSTKPSEAQLRSPELAPKQGDIDTIPTVSITPVANGIVQKPRPVSMIAIPSQDKISSSPSSSVPNSPIDSVNLSTSITTNGTEVEAQTTQESATAIEFNVGKDDSTAVKCSIDAGPSTKPSNTQHRSSTFRYVPRRPPSETAPRTSSPLRPSAHTSISARHFASSPAQTISHQSSSSLSIGQNGSYTPSPLSRTASPQTAAADLTSNGLKPISPTPHHSRAATLSSIPTDVFIPPQRNSSLLRSPSPNFPLPSNISAKSSASSTPPPPVSPSLSSTSTHTTSTYKASYRPGFQPKGVYRPRTDEYDVLREKARDVGRVERTRLERRFEKLLELHFFPSNEHQTLKFEKGTPLRRASSIFELDFNELREKGATELWRTVLDSRVAAANAGKVDIRSAEQKITPWENDADVSACPLCSASFHPLTNRKHHCRLCGQIICSLPPKLPQRPVPCSLLFVADVKTGRIEEVSEVVDYGVRPRGAGRGKGDNAEEKFLKGVRICRRCKPIMLRQQYKQDARQVPIYARLYESLISLESEIEDALPQFQELILNLASNPVDAPTKEATAARKRLLESFAEYDATAKKILKLPCPGGPGSSQERLQTAIMTRANLFLQKNMFPLQSLPKPKKKLIPTEEEVISEDAEPLQPAIDPDSQLAHALQPLLEQEALLESFIEEAVAHRKFEDAKTLRTNLKEIRAEINRIMLNAGNTVAENKK